MRQKRAFQILLLLCGVSLVVVWYLWDDYNHEWTEIEQAAENRARQESQFVIQQIEATLAELKSVANLLANEISTGQLPRQQIQERLKQVMEQTPSLFGVGVAYVPYVNNPQQRRQSPYYINRSDDSVPLEEQQQLLQLYTVPCYSGFSSTANKISNCVVFVDYSLNDLKALMATLDLGKTGYGFILSKQGVFINHPIPAFVKERKTIFNLATLKDDKALEKLGQRAVNHERGVIDYIDGFTGQASWIFYQPVAATGWAMCTVLIKEEFVGPLNDFRLKPVWLSLWGIVFLVLFSALLFHADKGENYRLWQVVSFAAVLLFMELGWIWYSALSSSFYEKPGHTLMVDQAGLYKFLASNVKQKPLSKEPPIYVATGIFIESLELLSANQVFLKGHIWQKYHESLHRNVARGFILPELQSATIIEAHRHQDNQTQLIVWSFEGTLHLPFDYSKYPLDNQEINLLIHHKEFDRNVILIPDLPAYKQINPNTRPALKKELVLSGWNIRSSFFNYRIFTDYFGNDRLLIPEKNFPNLYLTVFIQREVVNPFFGSVLPIIVVAGMLFALLLLLGKVEVFANVLTPLSVLLIGLILAHIGIRQTVPAFGIFYIEYYYVVMYLAIIGIIISYFLLHTNKNFLVVQYREGLIIKLLFWPVLLGSLLSITIWTFYF